MRDHEKRQEEDKFEKRKHELQLQSIQKQLIEAGQSEEGETGLDSRFSKNVILREREELISLMSAERARLKQKGEEVVARERLLMRDERDVADRRKELEQNELQVRREYEELRAAVDEYCEDRKRFDEEAQKISMISLQV